MHEDKPTTGFKGIKQFWSKMCEQKNITERLNR